MSPLVTEEELRELLQSPESRRRGFALLVKLYSRQIYWQMRRMVYSHDDANDLVQNTFLKAWDAIEGFRGEAKLSTWLYRIALYEGLSFVRRQRREQELLHDGGDQELLDRMMERLVADQYFDADAYELKFQRALLSLPEKQQLVFRLRYYDEMPYEQISSLTGTSTGALKASYHHAANRIREQLALED